MAATTLPLHSAVDPELHYGHGDDNALYNLFATWPETYFTTLPKPHGNRGIDEPYWELRQSQIFLDDWFLGRGAHDVELHTRSTIRFGSALDFAQEQAKLDNALALELAQHCLTPPTQRGARGARDPPARSISPTSPSSPPGREQEEYEEWAGLSDTGRDICNARALLRREKLDGLSPTAALIKLFDARGIPYVARWSVEEPDRVLGLVWTFPYCLRMWKRFPETMSFDNTYNTNRFKLPLFQVTGLTCLNSVYNATFGLIDNERREGFQQGGDQLNVNRRVVNLG
ncbi:ankyrin repeat domain-containing protein [Purpureocillium lavendulum]|uniref:Ankyrin repeat domain-containing protein n=1 Tax=Purpureocillium lavendulum TaxID=1247861 RepID=A0AB34FBG2_9HYPO|nr:ankyrin repeat domain-containing protein [Purpureocillium lavendulum]